MSNQTTTVKYLTFNGLVVIGKGADRSEARSDAERQAKEMGTLIRRQA